MIFILLGRILSTCVQLLIIFLFISWNLFFQFLSSFQNLWPFMVAENVGFLGSDNLKLTDKGDKLVLT